MRHPTETTAGERDLESLAHALKRIPWDLVSSLFVGGTFVYSPFHFHRTDSDIDLYAVSKAGVSAEDVLSFTSRGQSPPGDIPIDCLQTIFTGMPDGSRRISLHAFTGNAVRKISSLSSEPFIVWRTPAKTISDKRSYRSTSGSVIDVPIRVKSYPPSAYLAVSPLTYAQNEIVYYGSQIQRLLTYAVPVVDGDGFLTDNMLRLQRRLLSEIPSLPASPPIDSLSQYWDRHDDRSWAMIRLRWLASQAPALGIHAKEPIS